MAMADFLLMQQVPRGVAVLKTVAQQTLAAAAGRHQQRLAKTVAGRLAVLEFMQTSQPSQQTLFQAVDQV